MLYLVEEHESLLVTQIGRLVDILYGNFSCVGQHQLKCLYEHIVNLTYRNISWVDIYLG